MGVLELTGNIIDFSYCIKTKHFLKLILSHRCFSIEHSQYLIHDLVIQLIALNWVEPDLPVFVIIEFLTQYWYELVIVDRLLALGVQAQLMELLEFSTALNNLS